MEKKKLTAAERGIDGGRDTQHSTVGCVPVLTKTDGYLPLDLSSTSFLFFFLFFFFSFWCQDRAFLLVLNHLDFHLDVAVIQSEIQ